MTSSETLEEEGADSPARVPADSLKPPPPAKRRRVSESAGPEADNQKPQRHSTSDESSANAAGGRDEDDPVVSEQLVLLDFPELAHTRFFASAYDSQDIIAPLPFPRIPLSRPAPVAASGQGFPSSESDPASGAVSLPASSAADDAQAVSPLRSARPEEAVERAEVPCAAVAAAATVRSLHRRGRSRPDPQARDASSAAKNGVSQLGRTPSAPCPGSATHAASSSTGCPPTACTVRLFGLTREQPLALVGDCFSFVGRHVQDPLETVVLLEKPTESKPPGGTPQTPVAQRQPALVMHAGGGGGDGGARGIAVDRAATSAEVHGRKSGRPQSCETDVVAGLVGRSVEFVVDIQASAGTAAALSSSRKGM
ncbi:hypothetical protein BESB_029410 [Besnoitia besnoiti]|uniref:Uncharacterized protein n=1 Tax=Besnoitia besnoiti TaxID=94643 RepID=A0A2A9M6J1_BESBE|nr:uncharacterized protein BESB_029410 [Besnoitia besnoiti]PFH31506.1 hypothetical protein BESB_029410 [Besnoitia besnoiti]